MKPLILTGALVKLYINNTQYKEVQQVSWAIDYGEYEIFGIDSPFPQEIAPTKVTVKGSIQGLRVRNSGGIQAIDARPLARHILSAPYISIRIQDRSTGEDLIFIQSAKVTGQTVSVGAKGTLKLSFNFTGMLPYEPLDRIG